MNFKPIIEAIRTHYGNKPFIPLHEPRFSAREREYVMDAIDSTFVSSVGEYVNRFEKLVAQAAGTKYAVAIVNGTSALHLSLILAGVQRNDLVISQSLTFIATCNAISYIGAEPVFLDVDEDSLGLSPKALLNWLDHHAEVRTNVEGEKNCYHIKSGRKIAALVPMHTFGLPCRIDELNEICKLYQIPLVEDAAESIGSSYKGQPTGSFGLMGAFSFNGNKTITCGGGGAIVTNDEELARRGKHLSTQAKVPHAWEFKHDEVAYNYRMPNLNAAMACAQLEVLSDFVENKRQTAEMYSNLFEHVDGAKWIREMDGTKSNYWLNAIVFDEPTDRDLFLKESNEVGVMTRPVWELMHHLPMFKHCMHGSLENSEYLMQRVVNLPSSVRG
ncbi:MAG: LegC family aminotransferase [Chitinophagaceae bacterium]|nr:LegC family aminotransferase [Chitinophagaceae bacterium]